MIACILIYLITVGIYLYAIRMSNEDLLRFNKPQLLWQWTAWTLSFVFIPGFNTLVLALGLICYAVVWMVMPRR